MRLRSVPIDMHTAKKPLPRRAAILSGAISEERGDAHAYVVFESAGSVEAALLLNMTVVRDCCCCCCC